MTNPQPDERTQVDGQQEKYSLQSGIDFTGTDVIVRQEYKDDADINKMLARFGLDTQLRQMTWGAEIDERIDLQQALFAIDQAKRIQIPEELRGKYPTWQDILNAAETGAYQYDLTQLERRKKEAEEKEKGDTPEPPK